MKKFFTRTETAEMLEISEATLARIIWRKEIQYHLISMKIKFTQEDIDDYIERSKVPASTRKIEINWGKSSPIQDTEMPMPERKTGYIPGMKVV